MTYHLDRIITAITACKSIARSNVDLWPHPLLGIDRHLDTIEDVSRGLSDERDDWEGYARWLEAQGHRMWGTNEIPRIRDEYTEETGGHTI